MLRSMFTAITSLQLNQDYMDVVADNLANANTPGFKSNRITFKDQIAQLIRSGAAPTDTLGGINPTQIGLGATLGDITTNFSQGTMTSTGRTTDLAIQGDGFFIYTDPNGIYYSRDGALDMDTNGFLVNATTGMKIQGWSADAGAIDYGTAVGDIQVPIDATLASATSQIIVGGNLNAAEPDTPPPTYTVTMGCYDSQGLYRALDITFVRQGAAGAWNNTWNWSVTSADGVGAGVIAFDVDGQYDAAGSSVTTPVVIAASGAGGTSTAITLDMSAITQLASDYTVSALSQDGQAAGSLTGFSVSSNSGEIVALYSNGLQETIAQIALAKFTNPAGLMRSGESLWEVGFNSGEPSVGAAATGGRGTIVSGFLEASNVDLGQEFTNMIIAQRGFQAASRVITASDEMLQELVNVGR